MSNNKIQFTPEGYKKLEEELVELAEIKKPAAVIRLGKARAMGDLSENSEYTAAKEDLAFVDGRVKEIEELLRRAEIVETKTGKGIVIGAEVTVEKDGHEETYSIVGEFEADPTEKKTVFDLSDRQSPSREKEGDTVIVEVPAGKLNYKILKIKK